MAFPKSHVFPLDEQRVSGCGRALGYPARISILRLLKKHNVLQVHQFVNLMPLTEGAITEHLRKLRLIGLIEVEIRGLHNYYSLNEGGVRAVFEMQRALYEELVAEENVEVRRVRGSKGGSKAVA